MFDRTVSQAVLFNKPCSEAGCLVVRVFLLLPKDGTLFPSLFTPSTTELFIPLWLYVFHKHIQLDCRFYLNTCK